MGFSEYMKSLPYPRCKVVEALTSVPLKRDDY